MAEHHNPPEPKKTDHLHTLVRSGLSAIPVVGGAAVELLNALLGPPIEQRRNKFMRAVAEALIDLERRVEGLSMAALVNAPEFLSAILQAAVIAIRNHEEEKLEAAKNTVLNTAISPGEDLFRPFFLNTLDEVGVAGLQVLHFIKQRGELIRNPSQREGGLWLPTQELQQLAPPSIRNNFNTLVMSPLKIRGLVYSDMPKQLGLPMTLLTKLGERFLAFISSPNPVSPSPLPPPVPPPSPPATDPVRPTTSP